MDKLIITAKAKAASKRAHLDDLVHWKHHRQMETWSRKRKKLGLVLIGRRGAGVHTLHYLDPDLLTNTHTSMP